MALFFDPLDTLLGLQRALDSFRDSPWLGSSPSGGGTYPPLNVFRKGDDFVVIAEIPGLAKENLDIQVKNNTIRIAGSKAVAYPEKAGVHRRERLTGHFDRVVTLPVEVEIDKVQADYRDGILALLLPRAEHDKPRSIRIN
jgi:HSP20 family protein